MIHLLSQLPSIGSLGWAMNEAGVHNVTVESSTFTGTQNGVRVKSWARPSNGFVRDVHFRHLTMNNVENPIIIDQYYCPNSHCPTQVYMFFQIIKFLLKFINFYN